MLLADDRYGMAFLPQLDSSLDFGSVGAVKPLLVAYLADDQVVHLFADARSYSPTAVDDDLFAMLPGAVV